MEQTEYQEQLREFAQWIPKNRRIIFFGGAGVSTGSGIPDFRSTDGFYAEKRRCPPEQIVSHSFFLTHTERFYDFYREGMLCPDAKPSAAHPAFAALERQGELSAVIIQSIGGLHEEARGKRVLPFHGTVLKDHCLRCGKFYSLAELLSCSDTVPHCDCGGIIKPDVVLYEEVLDSTLFTEAVHRIAEADLLIVDGVLLAVYPVVGLLHYFDERHLIVINRSATSADRDVDLVVQAPIGEMLSRTPEKAH